MINIGITGSSGFIGGYLRNFFDAYADLSVIKIRRMGKDLDAQDVKSCDVIIHCAGVNRRDDQNALEDNSTIANDLVKKAKSSTRILYLSTTQAILNNAYGVSKRKAEEIILNHNSKNRVLRLPNIFGAGSRPYYNSVVATFCHQSVQGYPHSIENPQSALSILWVGDLSTILLGQIRNKADGIQILENFEEAYDTTVADISALISSAYTNIVEGISSASALDVAWKIESTLLSFFETNYYRTLTPHIDHRGSFTELLKTSSGQLSVLECGVAQERGMHFHLAKYERFYVLKGEAIFRSQKISGGEISELYVRAEDSKEVFTSPLYVHSIKNVGTESLIVAIWANENFRPEAPDTIAKGFQ